MSVQVPMVIPNVNNDAAIQSTVAEKPRLRTLGEILHHIWEATYLQTIPQSDKSHQATAELRKKVMTDTKKSAHYQCLSALVSVVAAGVGVGGACLSFTNFNNPQMSNLYSNYSQYASKAIEGWGAPVFQSKQRELDNVISMNQTRLQAEAGKQDSTKQNIQALGDLAGNLLFTAARGA